MAVQKTIAIIGATGSMGKAIAKSLAGSSYRLLLIASATDKLTLLHQEILQAHTQANVECMQCAFDACWEADIIIPAVPYAAEKFVAEKIRQVATGKIVISISNPFTESFTALKTITGKSAGEELQELLPYAHVVKAFNTVNATDFMLPAINEQVFDVLVAGNNDDAVKTVSSLVDQAGFNPVIAGDISVSASMENMQLMLMQLSMRNNYSTHAGWKVLHD
ncbi:NAD(P)-binding domain-containing protein [Panacibacter sp. DH6]|uniref:NAD(P)-binding domain-containing protein n=1 Tax=Panacibacter microcysteis TaxID=2793269 RepID=A0A931GXD8_9BACT|nr:NAD(P)-binding domain-containing protein [Panacibacter microcysteis]MBG9375449.1 NAD(P)-binding domain-containing protein [Panacibacter microcysteis]